MENYHVMIGLILLLHMKVPKRFCFQFILAHIVTKCCYKYDRGNELHAILFFCYSTCISYPD